MRYHHLALHFLAFSALGGCGDKKDPTAVPQEKLKSPSSLRIFDDGDGKVRLSWLTSNAEKDFAGYNIYGAVVPKLDALNLTEGEAIRLLDDSDQPIEAAKSKILPAFSYDENNPHALPGALPALNLNDQAFAALPIHQRNANDASEPYLPTCRPQAQKAQEAQICAPVQDNGEVSANANGPLVYDLAAEKIELEVGKRYCFFIFAVGDKGKSVSEASSNIACVVPKATIKSTIRLNNGDHKTMDLRKERKTCEKKCNENILFSRATTSINENSPDNTLLSWDAFESLYGVDQITQTFISPGKNLFIRRMGVYAQGFADTSLAKKAPLFTKYDPQGIKHGNGYAPEFQSQVLEPYGVYVIAEGEPSGNQHLDFYYHWLWINSPKVDQKSEITFELRLAKTLNAR